MIAITSVGLSLIYGTTGLVNFSHSEHVTWGAMVAWWINVDHHVNIILAGPDRHRGGRRDGRHRRPAALGAPAHRAA